MTIYKGDTAIVFRLDTGVDNLDIATKIEIHVLKPSGLEVTWTAVQYGTTSEITYTSTVGDLDESGNYILQAYIEWGTNIHYGDTTTIVVYEPLTSRVNVSQLIRIMATYYKNITIQTFAQYNASPEEGTSCEISYEDAELYSELARDELNDILNIRNITLTNIQTYVALSHLVADYIEMTNPDWNFRSQSMGSGVSFSRGEKTGPREALDKLLDQVEAAMKANRRSGIRMDASNILRTKDRTNYPRRFKMTQIPAFDFSEDGFDSEETSDLGDLTDRNS